VLKTRLVTAAILIPIMLGSVYFGGLAFLALVGTALLIAGYELFQMARQAGHQPFTLIGLALIAALLLDAFWQTQMAQVAVTVAVILMLVIGIFSPRPGWFASWGITLAGSLYVGWLGTYFLLVRALPNGMLWTTAALVTAWLTDTGAYLAGTRLGRNEFFPLISPRKTWEGALGGWIAAPLTTIAVGWILGLPLIHCLFLGSIIGVAATFGDLAESLLKRQTGVKDSSNIVPGHGGMLDRLDSLLFTAVVTYYYLLWFVHI
jgi:phosphatidate cytidylyltransferase